MHTTKIILSSTLFIMATLLQGCNDDKDITITPQVPDTTTQGSKATVAVLETTDLHSNILSYDYFRLTEDKSIGFERTATLITQARKEFPNTLLFDNGDTIQGTALADYQAVVKPISCNQTLAIYKVMNQFKFDGGGIGNHEFNYGLPFLNQVTNSKFDVDGVTSPSAQPDCGGPEFPLVLSNIYSHKTKQPLFRPYKIIDKKITATTPDGKTITSNIKVGIIGFTPPPIMSWDKRWLEGKVYSIGVKEAAENYIPKMKAEGAEIIVALAHGGLDGSPYSESMENGNYYLSKVKDIDVMLLGHSHETFPGNATQFDLAGVDKVKGTINGVPATMSSFWGKALGVIQLKLTYDGKKWVIDKSKTRVEARSIQNADKSYVQADPDIVKLVAAEHQATIEYVKTPIGTTDFNMTSYFADLGDPSAIEIVNQAQAAYIGNYIKDNLPQYANLPVLSVSAPFKSGFAGSGDYTDVASGKIAINNAADLYLYPNNVYAVKVTGADILKWLETAAKRFNRIDPDKTTAQELINNQFPGFNFDMFTSPDLSYQIDVTQVEGSRIRNLKYKGQAIDVKKEFIVATNNYRANSGNFPGLDGSKTIYAAPDTNRDALISYIKSVKNITRANNGSHRSWSFVPVKTAAVVTYTSAQNKLALAQAAGLDFVSVLQADNGTGKGLSVYKVDLSKAR
ncbi:bifunctional 2',3'-cyclic-nucleotide 2'-phosphodiesterase/3'-nucleotidase [Acinetobacter stercoris]|uniref:2',3'-cyclic-nucleotide 2'-phosphodiesterase/3'-nucleotidase n=1 Tax=Acinetobacter stercoris TaxID=2126983 RepID=A0A2U3MY16_9GAMM|nr:bifunctional 2',3'-cyclic-nucleotide 2'-phosphodiesterase/3'-nucleotidase [Acinetobacter stercoris]SPL70330.1 2',3'-cyclic-nucleotide 2'-phosphodiesterase/3'-nucleotidase precursor [Acinetobacter stercoris]